MTNMGMCEYTVMMMSNIPKINETNEVNQRHGMPTRRLDWNLYVT